MDWIISLIAVLVSMVTVIISYLSNRETLKNASSNMIVDHKIQFRMSVWQDIISLSDKLLIITNRDHFERLFNNMLVAKKNVSQSQEVLLNEINENCEMIRSSVFNLCAKIKIIDMPNKPLRDRIRKYADDIIAVYKEIQIFYLNEKATKEKYDEMVLSISSFGERSEVFSHTMQNYIAELQNKLFEINNEKKKDGK
ncbi:MAG: hypothetical protein IKM44_00015 [Clostridia bacterium]|nr:hypothetical protein [Clostridia bacterium]